MSMVLFASHMHIPVAIAMEVKAKLGFRKPLERQGQALERAIWYILLHFMSL